ncbi:MAG: ATP-binding protein [Bacteroidota bacterium]
MQKTHFLSPFLSLGITKDQPTSLQDKIRLTNIMAGVSIFAATLFAFFFSWFVDPIAGLIVAFMVPFFLIPLILNHNFLHERAMQFLLLGSGAYLAGLCALFGPSLQGHLYFAHFIALSAFLFRARSHQYYYYAYYFGLLFCVIGLYTWYEPIFPVNFPYWINSMVFMASILVLTFYLYLFNETIGKNEMEVERLLQLENERNVALNEAHQELQNLNNTLEKEVKLRTQELELSNSELRRSNQDLEQFAYAASHDLQEPIRMISNFSRLLEKRLKPHFDEDTQTYMGFIRDGVLRMSDLIKGLLRYSRVGRKESPFEATDIKKLVEGKLKDFHQLITEKQASIEFGKLPKDLICETEQIGILFANLIHNALKFNHTYPKILIQALEEGDSWVFMVADNGIGIPAEYQGQIFEIFRRLHHRNEYDGTGIGLSLCRKIIERHGGEIWLNSIPQKGTTFFFRIPKIPQQEPRPLAIPA